MRGAINPPLQGEDDFGQKGAIDQAPLFQADVR
jgi:hypothetical protein